MTFPSDYDPSGATPEQQQRYLKQKLRNDVFKKATEVPVFYQDRRIYNLILYTAEELAAKPPNESEPKAALDIREILNDHMWKWANNQTNMTEVERVEITVDQFFITFEYRNNNPILDAGLHSYMRRRDTFVGGHIVRIYDPQHPVEEFTGTRQETTRPRREPQQQVDSMYSPQPQNSKIMMVPAATPEVEKAIVKKNDLKG